MIKGGESTKELKRKNESKDAESPQKRPKTEELNGVKSLKEGSKMSQVSNEQVTFKNNESTKKPKPKNESNDAESQQKKLDAKGLSGTDKKILHLKKKRQLFKSKDGSVLNKGKVEGDGTKDKKAKKFRTGKEWKALHMQQKGKTDVLDVALNLKKLWNDLRRKDCKMEKKTELLKQTCDLLKNRAKEFTFAHDTVRVLECILAEGADTHRTLLYNELKGDLIPLVKSKYGKFVILKLLKYGTKEQKLEIMKGFHGHVVELIKHTEAATVVEAAFNECANATQRFEFVQEFFGPTFKFFKSTGVHSLAEVLEKEPDKKEAIVSHMKEELMKVLDKSVVRHSIVHHLLLQFFCHADPTSRSEIIESLREAIPEIVHTKDGSKAAMHAIWFGTAKDRKVIMKSLRTLLTKTAKEQYGHMVLLALFDCVDDLVYLQKNVIKEIKANLSSFVENVHARKVLIYLLNPRESHFIQPDVINILKGGEGAGKKPFEVRHAELKSLMSAPLLELVATRIKDNYRDNSFCLFALTVLQNAEGDQTEALKSVAELLVAKYTDEEKNTHPVESSGSSFLLKQLILRDKNLPTEQASFCQILVDTVPESVFKSWIDCNRGAFLLVSLLESERSSVIKRVKGDLGDCKGRLKKKTYKGAEILLKKLNGCK